MTHRLRSYFSKSGRTNVLNCDVNDALLQKKLLTIACVIGILACGACFAPVYRPPTPPPPRPQQQHIDLRGIRMIDVAVTDASDSHHIAAAVLAEEIVKVVNAYARETGVRANIPAVGVKKDAELQITILSQHAMQLPQTATINQNHWTSQMRVSATLTRRDGQILWHESDWKLVIAVNEAAEDEATFWEKLPQAWTAHRLATRFVHRMFYEDSDDR